MPKDQSKVVQIAMQTEDPTARVLSPAGFEETGGTPNSGGIPPETGGIKRALRPASPQYDDNPDQDHHIDPYSETVLVTELISRRDKDRYYCEKAIAARKKEIDDLERKNFAGWERSEGLRQ